MYLTAQNDELRRVVETEQLITSSLTLLELSDVSLRKGRSAEEIRTLLSFVSTVSEIVCVNEEISLLAARHKKSIRKKNPSFGIVDATHLATSQAKDALLLTGDNDFRGISGVKVLN